MPGPTFRLRRRKRRSKNQLAVTKTDAKCRVNRTYEDYLAFLALNFGVQTVELDTVIASDEDGKSTCRRDSRPRRGPHQNASRTVSRIPSAKNS